MRFNIFFNFPPGKAEVSLDFPDVDDKNYVFRFGLIEDKNNSVRWHKAGWAEWDKMAHLKTTGIERGKGYKIRIERKNKTDDKISCFIVEIDKEWPAEAVGGTSVSRPWEF